MEINNNITEAGKNTLNKLSIEDINLIIGSMKKLLNGYTAKLNMYSCPLCTTASLMKKKYHFSWLCVTCPHLLFLTNNSPSLPSPCIQLKMIYDNNNSIIKLRNSVSEQWNKMRIEMLTSQIEKIKEYAEKREKKMEEIYDLL